MGLVGSGGALGILASKEKTYEITKCTVVNITNIIERQTDRRFEKFYTYLVDYKVKDENYREITKDDINERFDLGSSFSCYYDTSNENTVQIKRDHSKSLFIALSVSLSIYGGILLLVTAFFGIFSILFFFVMIKNCHRSETGKF